MGDKELDLFIQGDEMKIIKIKNFSFISQCQMQYAYFQPKRSYYPRLFRLKIYPISLQEGYKDYLSIEIFKSLKDADPLDRKAFDIITWTFSIIDIKGVGRFYQSYTKENILHFPYKIEIPNFIKRSFLLERADELLPADILEVCCEATFLSYPGPAIEKILHLGNWKFEEMKPYNEKTSYTRYVANDCKTIIEKSEHGLIDDLCFFLRTFNEFREKRLKPESLKFWRNTLVDHLPDDDVLRTYMHLNPYFQTYQLLKWKLMELLEVFSDHNIEKIELHKPWCQIRRDLIEKLEKQRNELEEKYRMFPLFDFCNTIDLDLYKIDASFFETHKEARNKEYVEIDKWKLFITAIEYELENFKACENILDKNEVCEDNWNFVVETKDGLTFTLPFRKDRETIGSKLVSNSWVFKNMLTTPMRERVSKNVKLIEVDSVTFLNILKYLQRLEIDHSLFPQISSLYEVADQYELKELMQLCAAWMRPLLTPEIVDKVELLAYLHSDEYLNEMVSTYKAQIMNTDSLIAEFNLIHSKQDFDFYS